MTIVVDMGRKATKTNKQNNASVVLYVATVVPRPLSNDPRFTQCIYRYSRASKRFVEVYTLACAAVYQPSQCFSYF